jgi:hypothetical protein
MSTEYDEKIQNNIYELHLSLMIFISYINLSYSLN